METFANEPGPDHQRWYVTKYALSGGVTVYDGPYDIWWSAVDQRDYVSIKGNINLLRVGRDVWRTKSEAEGAVRSMIKKKLASIEKQAARLRALDPVVMVAAAEELAQRS